MRRATLLVLATIVVMVLATGAALAANFTGDGKNNVLKGTAYPDTIKGEGGADAIYGRAGDDTLEGGSGNDNYQTTLYDKNKNQITAGLRGAGGNDTVKGGSGNDDVIGNGGDDTLDDSSATNLNDYDRAFGGTGKDSVDVADGDTNDEVSCGTNTDGTPAEDTAKIDVLVVDGVTKTDKVYDCENVVDNQSAQDVAPSSLPHMQPSSADYDPTPPGEPSSVEPA